AILVVIDSFDDSRGGIAMVPWTAAAANPAAAPDTWGISGPTFLTFYAIAALLAFGFTLARRIAILGHTEPSTESVSSLRPSEIAMLVDDKRPVLAGLAQLRGYQLIDSTGRPVRQPTDADQRWLDTVSNALFRHLLGSEQRSMTDLRAAGILSVARMRADLTERGYLFGPKQRKALYLAALPMDALLILGIVRLIAGMSAHHKVGFLVLALIVLLVATGFMIRSPRLTQRGRDALDSVRSQHLHLRPNNAPSYGSYGPNSAAFAAALFGAGVLWSLDPALAQATAVVGGGYGGSGGGDSCSTGSSCSTSSGDSGGGSSCGSSCGSGCGGGGCGG
ncbi:TIGR04222 domain-containing membrane protein, partial [Nocardia sp. JMUB6875]|uniref:TIGR04222 domain-containing membrane protein n=1 Tax=Nocardia sp. JMUB6875 TaxID=3158170 RepID=UPI0034E8416A